MYLVRGSFSVVTFFCIILQYSILHQEYLFLLLVFIMDLIKAKGFYLKFHWFIRDHLFLSFSLLKTFFRLSDLYVYVIKNQNTKMLIRGPSNTYPHVWFSTQVNRAALCMQEADFTCEEFTDLMKQGSGWKRVQWNTWTRRGSDSNWNHEKYENWKDIDTFCSKTEICCTSSAFSFVTLLIFSEICCKLTKGR